MAFERRTPGIKHELGNYRKLKHMGLISYPKDRVNRLEGTQLSKAGSMDGDMHILPLHDMSPLQVESVMKELLEKIPEGHEIMVTAPGERHWNEARGRMVIQAAGSKRGVPVRIKRVNIMRDALPDHVGGVHPKIGSLIDGELGPRMGIVPLMPMERQQRGIEGLTNARKAEIFRLMREHSANLPKK